MYTATRILVNPAQIDMVKQMFEKQNAQKCVDMVFASPEVEYGEIIICDDNKKVKLHFKLG